MTQIEYLSLSGFQRFFYNIGHFFVKIPEKTASFCSKLPSKLSNLGQKLISPVETVKDAAVYGDWRTRLSFLIMGFGQMTRRQIIRGCLYFAYEVFFIIFMVLAGAKNLSALSTFGQMGYTEVIQNGAPVYYYYDDSLQILIYSVIAIFFILILAFLYIAQLKDSLKLQRASIIGIKTSDKETLNNILDASYHRTLLSIPMVGLVTFTIIPISIMILIAFTNYDTYHLTPKSLIDWVGVSNFAQLFGQSSENSGNGAVFLQTFGQVLLWTLLWAFFATFSNYFLGMIVAMMINKKGIKLKKLWRTILITTIAVPQFISLLLVSRMFNQDQGFVNSILRQWGWINANIPWLIDGTLAKVMIIIINTWIGIPYTMLICTGLLMNIPGDLYESAKIDGASPARTYFKITLPYMLFVTTPYLISQFVGNINNFNVIYLLTQGGPNFTYNVANVPTQLNGVGKTDLLITWIYKICMTNVYKDYGTAAVLGIMVFVIVAFFSLIFYNNSKSVKNEEDFQL